MFDEVRFLQNIDRNINLWNFDFVEKELFLYYKNSKTIEDRFLSFLYYTGNFNKYAIESDSVNHLYFKASQKIESTETDFDKIENNFINYKDLPKDIVLCMIFNKICEHYREFNVESFLSLYKIYIFPSKNKLTKSYFVFKFIQACQLERREELFFVKELLDLRYYLLIQLFHDDSEGARRYYEIFIKKIEILLRRSNKHQPKIAACMYGPLRGDWKATMEHNLKILHSELNADVFIFTWSQKQIWQRMSAGGNCWANRKLSKDLISQCPKSIYLSQDFKQNFPSVWKKMNQDIYCDLAQQELKNLKRFYSDIKKIAIEDQEAFEKENSDAVELKMYYGIFKSFELLKNYEDEMNIRYDYVISMRSDSEIISNGDMKKEILSLNSFNILDIHTPAGSGVGNVIGCRNAIEIYSSLYKNNYFFDNTMMFDRFKSPHGVFFKWLSYNGIYIAKRKFDIEHRYTSCMRGYKMPCVAEELFLDLQNFQKTSCQKDFNDIVCFFQSIFKYFNGLDFDDAILFFSAKARIRKHLSYKLGQAMIVHSKSIVGYMKMPFVLFYIKVQYNQEQKKYQKKLKQNQFPLLRDCLDYKEALKEKKCLTYKLGEALIQASKTWYLGGYIKLIFEIKRLKKEYCDKRTTS